MLHRARRERSVLVPVTALLDTALALHAAGLSVVPVAADGTKRPRIAWKQHTTTAATAEQLHGWFANDQLEQGIGLVTGFGGVEMLEVEGKAMSLMGDVLDLLEDVAGELPDSLLEDLRDKIDTDDVEERDE